jgi:hypothetical protein
VPHAEHDPPLASVLPPQQAPEAQPRAQLIMRKPLPSDMHSLSVEPSQVAPWLGLQALQRLPLQPLAQLSSA